MEQYAPIIVIGGGPAGLMAAETLATAGHKVAVYDQKPSVGRKFLMAGRGGLNLTHSEELPAFLKRYGGATGWLSPAIQDFTPEKLRAWCEGLGQETFIGSSGRVFPKSFKASPLLRAWLARLENLGVVFHTQQRWDGWDDQGNCVFINPEGACKTVKPQAVILALGGASWPKLGSDGAWTEILKAKGLKIAPLRPSNCGFHVNWSDIFKTKFAGQPIKPITLSFANQSVPGEMMVSEKGLEGGAIYALSSLLREEIEGKGEAVLTLDLRPGFTLNVLIEKLQANRRRDSFSTWLKRAAGLSSVAIGLLMERPERKQIADYSPEKLAKLIKNYEIILTAPFAIDRAISSAGGIPREECNNHFMLKKLPGVFAAGEMLDWEAPTGGYLLQASFATGIAAAQGAITWLKR